jgi:subtilisin family serine protease
MRTVLVALALAALLSGCLGGGSGRTEWAYHDSQIAQLADQGRTGRGVTVAFLDTGLNVRHPSLAHLADGNRDNGELVGFRDFLGTATTVAAAFDDSGHGTHVTGVVSARGSSGLDKLGGIDLRGGAPDALVLSARVCNRDQCDADAIPLAIQWAVAQGADVVSLSLGGQFGLSDLAQQLAIRDAVARAVDAGVVIIASAGNKGDDPSSSDVESPADLPDIIAVGAVGPDGQVAPFSSRGSSQANTCRFANPLPVPISDVTGRCYPDQKPELVAPGVGILSAWTGDDYVRADGTSQATPFVTAAVALLLQGKPDLGGRADVERVKLALVATAQPVPGQTEPHDPAAGYGLLQAADAVRAYG